MPDQQPAAPDPYVHPKFTDKDQEAVHNSLVGLIRSKLGPDLADMKDDEVLQAAHLAYAPDLDPEEFVTGAKMVMSEQMHGALQKEADRRSTEAGHPTTEGLALRNLHVTPPAIKGVSVSGVPGVEAQKAAAQTAGNVVKELGKGVLSSLATPVPALMEWVGAHGLTDEQVAPGVYETRFAGANEQQKLEREAVRKVARAALDTAGWGIGAVEVGGAALLPGLTNAFARMAVEGAGWGATYEGTDAALAGESANDVATKAARGAVLGGALTLGLGSLIHGAAHGLSKLVSNAIDERAAQVAAKASAVTIDPPVAGASPGERVVLMMQKDGAAGLPDEVQKYVQMAQRGDMDPQTAAIHVLGNLGIVNDAPGTEAMAKILVPHSLAPVSHDMALTISEAAQSRLNSEHALIRAAASARRMAEEAATFTSELQTRAEAEKWGRPEAAANLAQAVPEPIVLPAGDQVHLVGGGASYSLPQALALREAAAQMPHLSMTVNPRGLQGKIMSSVYKIGDQAYDLTGTAHEVLGYSTTGKVIVRRQYPDGVWAYHALPATNLSPNPSGFLGALNRFEAGAKARLAEINRNPRLSTGLDVLEGAREYIEIGIGKFGRAVYMGQKFGLSEDQIYVMWAKDMADHMRANGHEAKIQFLPKMYSGVKKEYGETLATLVLRDNSLREGLYDASDRMKKGGWVGADWYDHTFPKLVELFGTPEDASTYADFLAITSAGKSVDSNTTLALQAFAQWQAGDVPHGYGPNHDAMFKRWAVAEAKNAGEAPRVEQFATKSNAPKVSRFVSSVRGEAVNEVVLDRWMNRYMAGKEVLGVKERAASIAIIKEIAQKEGMTPRQVQAAMWADARIAEQVLEPFNKDGKVSMKLASFRPYEQTSEHFLKTRGSFAPEAKAIHETRANGGGTFYPETYRTFDKPGFSVALGGKTFKEANILPNQVRETVNAYLGPLKKVAEAKGRNLDFVVGTYKKDGKIYAEVGVVLPNRVDALHLGNIAKQFSVGELGPDGSFLKEHETGIEKPSANSVTDAKAFLKEWLDAPSPNR